MSMNKKLFSLVLIYFFQFLVTSCETCECETPKTYEQTYDSVEIKTWDTSGFQIEEATSNVNKNSFGITVNLSFNLKEIAHFKQKLDVLDFSALGFSKAYACSCVPDDFINKDPVKSIEITVTNTETEQITNVTDNFISYNFNGEKINVRNIFNNNNSNFNGSFQIELATNNNIPNTAVFTITVILESGNTLTESTPIINFE